MSNAEEDYANIELFGFNDKGEAIVRESGVRQELSVDYIVGNSVDYSEQFRMKVFAKSHTNQTLQEVKANVLKELNDLGVPETVSKKELYDLMDISTPQEIGAIKARLGFLDKIDEAINE